MAGIRINFHDIGRFAENSLYFAQGKCRNDKTSVGLYRCLQCFAAHTQAVSVDGGYAELVVGQLEQAACQNRFGFVVRNGENGL